MGDSGGRRLGEGGEGEGSSSQYFYGSSRCMVVWYPYMGMVVVRVVMGVVGVWGGWDEGTSTPRGGICRKQDQVGDNGGRRVGEGGEGGESEGAVMGMVVVRGGRGVFAWGCMENNSNAVTTSKHYSYPTDSLPTSPTPSTQHHPPAGGKDCKVSAVIQIDIKGWFPAMVVNNAVGGSFGDFFGELKAALTNRRY